MTAQATIEVLVMHVKELLSERTWEEWNEIAVAVHQTLDTLPAAVTEAVARRAQLEAFVAAYDRFAECLTEFSGDASYCGEWFDAVEQARAALAVAGDGAGADQ